LVPTDSIAAAPKWSQDRSRGKERDKDLKQSEEGEIKIAAGGRNRRERKNRENRDDRSYDKGWIPSGTIRRIKEKIGTACQA